MDVEQPWRRIDNGANIGQSSAWWWAGIVRLQLRRILTEHDGSQEIMDAHLLLLALRQVIRGAEMSRNHAKTDQARDMITAALAKFDSAIPGGKDARDVIEHFDEYSQGVGRLQQPGVKAPKRVPNEQHADDFSIVPGWDATPEGRRPILAVGPFRIDLITAEDAAFRLHTEVYEAVLAGEGRGIQPGWAYSAQRLGPMPPVPVERTP